MINGSIEKKVDILVLGDGYAKGDIEKFRKDAKHFTEQLFRTSHLKNTKNDFNVRAMEVISDDSGIDKPVSKCLETYSTWHDVQHIWFCTVRFNGKIECYVISLM